MKLLVTGGVGFIGSNFIHYWLKKYPRDQIVNLDKLTYAGNLDNLKDVAQNPRYTFIKGDICNGKLVNQVVEGIDTIVHMAAESHVDRSILGPQVFVKTNVIGTQVLLDAAVRHQIKRFHHVSCYDEKTRAFTQEGLRTYNEIRQGDLVLTLNPENCKIEWKPVKKVIIQHYQGKMIKVKTKTVDLLVTPNHRMLFQMKRSKKLVYKIAEESKREAINKLPKYYQWKGKISRIIKEQNSPKDFMYLLGIFIGDGFLGYQEKKVINKTGLSRKEYLKKGRNRFGQFTSIGKVGNKKFSTQKSWRIFLDIPQKNTCRKKCEKSLTRLGIKWYSHKGKAGEHLYFTSKKFSKIFRDCGKYSKNKKIPRWALEAPLELLLPLWKGLLDSDGSKRRIFFTSSPKLASQFIELCVKLGLSPSMKPKYTSAKIEDRKVSGHSFVISIGREWRSVRREIVEEKKYKGKVWCLKVEGNKNFLIERNGKTVFCGNTDEVFGALPLKSKKKFNESTLYNPRNPYSASKAASDHLVRSFYHTYQLPITITNCSNNFGPFQHPEKMIPQIILNAFQGKLVPIYGDGLYVRDWLYVEDHCRAIDLVLKKGKVGETYLVGGQTREVNNLQLAKMILKLMKKDEKLIKFVKDRPGHDRRYAVDWRKIKKELTWQPQHDFKTSLQKTIAWYQKNQWWWKNLN